MGWVVLGLLGYWVVAPVNMTSHSHQQADSSYSSGGLRKAAFCTRREALGSSTPMPRKISGVFCPPLFVLFVVFSGGGGELGSWRGCRCLFVFLWGARLNHRARVPGLSLPRETVVSAFYIILLGLQRWPAHGSLHIRL